MSVVYGNFLKACLQCKHGSNAEIGHDCIFI